HQLLVELAAEHHLDHLEGGRVGDADAAGEARLDAEALEHGADLLAAAVDHHHPAPHPGEQDHILGDALAAPDVLEDSATYLDHRRLAAELLDVGQRLDEYASLVDELLHGHRRASIVP